MYVVWTSNCTEGTFNIEILKNTWHPFHTYVICHFLQMYPGSSIISPGLQTLVQVFVDLVLEDCFGRSLQVFSGVIKHIDDVDKVINYSRFLNYFSSHTNIVWPPVRLRHSNLTTCPPLTCPLHPASLKTDSPQSNRRIRKRICMKSKRIRRIWWVQSQCWMLIWVTVLGIFQTQHLPKINILKGFQLHPTYSNSLFYIGFLVT